MLFCRRFNNLEKRMHLVASWSSLLRRRTLESKSHLKLAFERSRRSIISWTMFFYWSKAEAGSPTIEASIRYHTRRAWSFPAPTHTPQRRTSRWETFTQLMKMMMRRLMNLESVAGTKRSGKCRLIIGPSRRTTVSSQRSSLKTTIHQAKQCSSMNTPTQTHRRTATWSC